MRNLNKAMKTIEFIKKSVKAVSSSAFVKGAMEHYPKGHLLSISALSGLLLLGATIASSIESPKRTSQPLALSIVSTSPSKVITADKPIAQVKSDIDSIYNNWHVETVKAGDSLSVLFNRAGLADTVLYHFLNSSKAAKQLTKVFPGQTVDFNLDANGKLLGLRYQKSRLESILFERNSKGFAAKSTIIKPDVYNAYREATITNSLFLAGTRAGMEESLIMELASIFGWDVDFALDIRANDSFKVLYEEHFVNGEKLRNGPILAAEFTNQNKTFRAVRFTDEKGVSNYYTPKGKSMRKAFLRTPVDFARISSHFNLQRKHPILNRIRAHKGTDYAAPTGTPIRAAGNGKVAFKGTKGGYGRTVIIRHGQSYKTLYAHMHKYGRGIKSGVRVKQGQVIGYVGKSGLATGPHLHYEFYKNGVVRNPVSVELPKAKSIPKAQLATFKLQTRPLVAQLDKIDNSTQFALSDSAQPKSSASSTN